MIEIDKIKAKLYRFEAVLTHLVECREHKLMHGKDAHYTTQKNIAWENAYKLLGKEYE